MPETLKIDGLKELNRALKELPEKAAKAALKSGVRAGGAEIVRAMRRELKPYNDTKNLSRSLATKVLKPNRYSITAIIGPRVGYTGRGRNRKRVKNDGWYARLIEYGVGPHKIKGRGGRTLYIGNGLYAQSVNHPGFKARPFMRPGFEKSKSIALAKIREKLWQAIERETKKLR